MVPGPNGSEPVPRIFPLEPPALLLGYLRAAPQLGEVGEYLVRCFGGFEFAAGIPGTVGGALAMNAGCYGGETWDIVERVVTINRRGQLRRRAACGGRRGVGLPAPPGRPPARHVAAAGVALLGHAARL